MVDDDDDFLYGGSKEAPEVVKTPVPTSVPQPISLEQTRSASQGLVAHLEAEAAETTNGDVAAPEYGEDAHNDEDEGGEGDEEEDDSEDDVEIIMEPTSRTLDFRQQGAKPTGNRSTSFSTPTRGTYLLLQAL